jgi:hypothetical protein
MTIMDTPPDTLFWVALGIVALGAARELWLAFEVIPSLLTKLTRFLLDAAVPLLTRPVIQQQPIPVPVTVQPTTPALSTSLLETMSNDEMDRFLSESAE